MKYHYDIRAKAASSSKHVKTYATGVLASLIAVIGLAAAPAFAAAITNGSFETGTDPGVFTTLFAGDSTSIPGWTVTSGSVDYIGTYWTASNGSRSLDMSGNGAGAISQTLSTVAGHTYTVTFDMAGNPDGSPAIKTLNVDAGGLPSLYSFDVTGHDKTNMGWEPQTFNFTATGTSTNLTFTSTVDTPFGPALDNVVVSLDSPTNKDQCKNDGWKEYANPSFKNQGDCVSFVATKGKNLPSGS